MMANITQVHLSQITKILFVAVFCLSLPRKSKALTSKSQLSIGLMKGCSFTNCRKVSFLFNHDSNQRIRRKYHKQSRLSMGLEVNIRIVGRKNSIESTSFLQESYEEYTKRLSSTIKITTTFHKSDQDLLKNLQSDSKKGYGVVCLDEKGDMFTSIDFSEKLYSWLEEYGSRMVFVIGAAEGLPKELKQYQFQGKYSNDISGNGVLNRSPMFMSLSKMTFTHPWARTILVEQIYRASEIHKGSGYHKE